MIKRITKIRKIAIVLAGGKGTRLWPLSRENYPKQFVEFSEGESLFQMTLKRLLGIFSAEDIFIISQENYRFTISNQIDFLPKVNTRSKNLIKNNIILEPASKSTLPAILLSLKYIENKRGFKKEDILYIFPSDHIVEPLSEFKKGLKKAGVIANAGRIAVFGIKPASAKVGFGYILAKDKFKGGFLVDKFIEKPSFAKAKVLVRKGAFWNSGIFCFNIGVFLNEVSGLKPELYKFYNLSYKAFLKGFGGIRADSIDYGIIEKTKNVAMVRLDLKWSDLGSWDSLLEYYTDGSDNFNIGNAEFVRSKNCFAYSKNRLLALVGLDDVIAVDSADAVLLVKKGYSDRVKELVNIIDKKGYLHTKDSSTVYRPWGYYTVLHEAKNYKVKEIGIYPKKALSLQKHKFRSEHWNVVSGMVSIYINKKEKKAKMNESIFVPRNTLHRVFNPSNKIAKIIETQIGSYVGEDDITRYSEY